MKNSLRNQRLENIIKQENSEDIATALEKIWIFLTVKEKDVIQMRLGIGNYDRKHTLKEIALKYNRSRERIRQIERKGLLKASNKIYHKLK